MTFKEMIETLRVVKCNVLIRDYDNNDIGIFDVFSKGLDPYMGLDVSEWFPFCPPWQANVDFVVLLDDRKSK